MIKFLSNSIMILLNLKILLKTFNSKKLTLNFIFVIFLDCTNLFGCTNVFFSNVL